MVENWLVTIVKCGEAVYGDTALYKTIPHLCLWLSKYLFHCILLELPVSDAIVAKSMSKLILQ